jgi:hypothetical protein
LSFSLRPAIEEAWVLRESRVKSKQDKLQWKVFGRDWTRGAAPESCHVIRDCFGLYRSNAAMQTWNPWLWYKVVQIWPGLFVCKQVTVCPGHIWTTLYMLVLTIFMRHKSAQSWLFYLP